MVVEEAALTMVMIIMTMVIYVEIIVLFMGEGIGFVLGIMSALTVA